jgi:SM-20-related protein
MSGTLDLAAFHSTPLTRDPFEFLIVPNFIKAHALPALRTDYPHIDKPGSFPHSQVDSGPAFNSMLHELQGPEMRAAFEEKFRLDLKGRPVMITVRGRSGDRDGNIHTDSLDKLITVLIYMNPTWDDAGGRLRLLRSPDNLDDVIVEVPPEEGLLLAFRRSNNSYHGHKLFIGERRVIQFNWVTSRWVLYRESWRHRFSAWVKRLLPGARPAKQAM